MNKEPFVLETMKKCLNMLEILRENVGCHIQDRQCGSGGEFELINNLKSAIEIVEHECVPIPRSLREAQLMMYVAENYIENNPK